MPSQATPENVARFADLLIDLSSHRERIEFDLLNFNYEAIKFALEIRGYSVHRDAKNREVVLAFRGEPDRAPPVLGCGATRYTL